MASPTKNDNFANNILATNKNSNSSKLTIKVTTNQNAHTIDTLKDIMSPNNQSYLHLNTESSKFRNQGYRNRNIAGSVKMNNLVYRGER